MDPLKLFVLCVSVQDAHEFLTCVLDELRSLSVDLHAEAARMGTIYTCPVDAHMAFQMLSTRTCKRYEYAVADSLIFGLQRFPVMS